MKFKTFKTLILLVCLLFTDSLKINRKSPLCLVKRRVLGRGSFGTVYEYEVEGSKESFAVKLVGSKKDNFLRELDFLIRICPSKVYPVIEFTKTSKNTDMIDTFKLIKNGNNDLIIEQSNKMKLSDIIKAFKSVQDTCIATAPFSFGEYNGEFYFVFKKFQGDLLSYLDTNENNLKKSERIEIMIQLTEMLNKLHNKGIQQKDLKPENILYNRKNKLVLSDFGLSCFMGD